MDALFVANSDIAYDSVGGYGRGGGAHLREWRMAVSRCNCQRRIRESGPAVSPPINTGQFPGRDSQFRKLSKARPSGSVPAVFPPDRPRLSLAAALFGWAIAAAIGIPLGLVLGLVRPLERLTLVTIEALRPVPSAALIPIVLLIFGFSLELDATVAAFACLWPVLIVTTGAVRGIEPRLLEVGRALGYGTLGRIWHFALPAALPGIAVGLRVAFGIAIVVTVTVEIAANPRPSGLAKAE